MGPCAQDLDTVAGERQKETCLEEDNVRVATDLSPSTTSNSDGNALIILDIGLLRTGNNWLGGRRVPALIQKSRYMTQLEHRPDKSHLCKQRSTILK